MLSKTLKNKLMMQAAVLAAPLLLVGCSSVPDAVNPVEWYRSSVEYFNEDDTDVAEQADSGSEAGDVAEAAPEAQKKIESGFVAAQTPQRQYAQPVMRQGQVVNALNDSTDVDVAAQPPAPKAAPTEPVITTQINENPVIDTNPAENRVVASTPTQSSPIQPTQPRDTRSVSEVYEANLAQTRPLNSMDTMNNTSAYELNTHPFETVVISSNGVQHQGAAYGQQPTQVAALNNVMTTDVRSTYAAGMAIEPQVVRSGQALSLSQYNPSMFTGSFQVATIQFGVGSASLSNEDVRILKEVLSIHNQQGGVIRIVGHASSRTRNMTPEQHMQVNHKVALSRADKVANKLLQLGMPGDRLFVGGVSDSQPLYQEVMPSGEAGNRRTEIFVDY
ncbi:MAG: OmpA family protein [Methylocystaceae bacterium]|nr:OmpA family protein [Methylocystaceae bacterium]